MPGSSKLSITIALPAFLSNNNHGWPACGVKLLYNVSSKMPATCQYEIKKRCSGDRRRGGGNDVRNRSGKARAIGAAAWNIQASWQKKSGSRAADVVISPISTRGRRLFSHKIHISADQHCPALPPKTLSIWWKSIEFTITKKSWGNYSATTVRSKSSA